MKTIRTGTTSISNQGRHFHGQGKANHEHSKQVVTLVGRTRSANASGYNPKRIWLADRESAFGFWPPADPLCIVSNWPRGITGNEFDSRTPRQLFSRLPSIRL